MCAFIVRQAFYDMGMEDADIGALAACLIWEIGMGRGLSFLCEGEGRAHRR